MCPIIVQLKCKCLFLHSKKTRQDGLQRPVRSVKKSLRLIPCLENINVHGEVDFDATTYCHPSAYTLRMNSIAQGFESILHFCAAIIVQFEQDTCMVDESDGMKDVRVAASGRTSFEYTFTVTPMDLTATSKLDGFYTVYVCTVVGMVTDCEDVTYTIEHPLSLFVQITLTVTQPMSLRDQSARL